MNSHSLIQEKSIHIVSFYKDLLPLSKYFIEALYFILYILLLFNVSRILFINHFIILFYSILYITI